MPRLMLFALALIFPAVVLQSQDQALFDVLQQEMNRSISGLRMEGQPAPYYIAYSIVDATRSNLLGILGAIAQDETNRGRMLFVEVRVGSYDFDSSRFMSFEREAGVVPIFAQGGAICPLDENLDSLRRQLWLTTDAAYKRAVQVFSKKKAAFENRVETERLPDFSKEPPAQTVLTAPPLSAVGKEWTDAVRQVSAVFAQHPDVFSSEATLSVTQGSRYYLNSEGFKSVTPIRTAGFRVLAETQADDGMSLQDFFLVYGNAPQDLPAVAELVSRARNLATGLGALRSAPAGEEFSGPVLFEGQAVSELLAQSFVPLLLSIRPPDSDNPAMIRMSQSHTSPYLTRIGSRVLPDSFSVTDTPSQQRFGNLPLPGSYSVDDEGVPAVDVALVKDGKLQTLLTSRTPQKNLLRSNGHARGGTAQASVFQVQSSKAVPASQLKGRYLELLREQSKPFGYIVRSLANPGVMRSSSFDSEDLSMLGMMAGGPGGAATGPRILQAVRVFADGREEPVRGLNLGSITHTTFRDILEASEERALYTYRPSVSAAAMRFASGFGRDSGETLVSVIAPNLILEDLEVQKVKEIQQKLPIVASPLK